ncbi:MAG: hypothetical protein N3G22_04640 [Candidatus Micrarchaeota archaeon]|nr:hypothetical protein [Candidatus Micrarchaeota archaeon]
MAKIVKVGVLSVTKIAAVYYLLIGVLYGILLSALAVLTGSISQAIGFLLFTPLFFAMFGAIFAAISVFLYNVCSGFVGPIEVEVKQ